MPDPAHATEMAYAAALVAVAQGIPRATARRALIEAFGEWVPLAVMDSILNDARFDAIKQGVEREDIDPSWFPS